MKTCPEIIVQDIPRADFVRTDILSRVRKLTNRHPDITKCRVAVHTPHKSQLKGRQFRVQIDITVPGSDIVATNDASANNEHLLLALNEAFDRLHRQLNHYRTARRSKDRRSSRKVSVAALASGPDDVQSGQL